jgi:thioredoxin-like negative regulator of GroEL
MAPNETGMTDPTTPVGVVLPITDANYSDLLDTVREPILMAFMSENHSTCRALRPVLTKLATERAGRLTVGSIDVASNPATTRAWGVTWVPVILLINRGVLQRVLRGVRPYARLIQEIDEMMPVATQNRYVGLL